MKRNGVCEDVDVTALGELLIDFAPVSTDKDGFPTMAAKPGGAPANYLATLARYGAKTALLAKVGADAFGSMLVRTLQEAGIETTGIVKDASVFTTLAFVTLDKNGERSFSFARKPGADTCLRYEELDLSLIDNSKIFHFGTLSLTDEPARETTMKALAYAKAAGKLITFDPNLRASLWSDLEEARKWILWGLKQADIVKIGDEEAEFLWECGEQEAAARLLDEYDIKLVMVTCGPKGAYIQNNTTSAFAVCPPVTRVDTTGAGDVFGGAAVSRILKTGKAPEELAHEELKKIVTFAVTAASLSTRIPGGIPGIPCEQEVVDTIKRLSDTVSDNLR